jgi:hypothetical protein
MPYEIRKGTGEKPYKIINKNTGEQVGSSKTREEAEASVKARNIAENQKERVMAHTIIGVEVFKAGTWNGMKFTIEDLKQIVTNTNKLLELGEHKPPLKLGHSTNQILKGQTDGDPAIGHPTNFRMKNDAIIADFENVPDIIHRTIKAKLFTTLSPEIEHIKHFGWFMRAVSLLGADIPAIKSISDLETFLSDSISKNTSDISQHLAFSEPIFKNRPDRSVEMADEDKKEVKTVVEKIIDPALVKKNKELEDNVAAQATKFADQEKELADLRQEKIERNFADKKSKFLSSYIQDVKDGKLLPAVLDKIEKHLETQKASFSEDSELTVNQELVTEISNGYSEPLNKGDEGESGHEKQDTQHNADVKLSQAIKKVIVESGNTLSYTEADEIVLETQPKLYDAYMKQNLEISEGRI